ncbi:hypothetical protein EST38_g2957 [Candolleomyces aberdarensis]|uniref:rRNA biogenesis protein RRP36 n=1 Tax=Candolleomyces aberdarensis TaxID=2316362 RepID=A0A4Q2DUB2_9AGAR|nr:hypothetical protein EST38_g2957 [Candolleomyces aberdarensis]
MVRRRSAKATASSSNAAKNVTIVKKGRKTYEESESSSSNEFEEGSSQDGLSDAGQYDDDSDVEKDDDDADAPRIVQWDDDDDLDYDQAGDEEEEEDSIPVKPKASKLSDLEKNLKSLPLGTLRKAQSALYQAEVETEDEEGSGRDSTSDSESDAEDGAMNKKKEKVEWTSKETRKKRSNKNAPMEVTSKKPVSRKRTVVEVPKIVARDPRFLPMVGDFKPEVFQKSYGFLNDTHTTELQTLRDHLKRARKLLSSSPRDQLEEREAEVERLERAVKRAESLVNKDRQDNIRQDALARAKRQEKEKRNEAEKQELFNKARFEAIAAKGGGRAVKKAIEKKQKKMGQKEKRSRPYAKGEAFDQPSAPRKRFSTASSGEGRPNKKQRFS